MIIRRLVLVISIVVSGSLALAAAVLAAGSGGLPPGQTLFSEMSANAFFGGKGGPPEGFSVFVNQGLNSFEPEDSTGSAFVTHTTMVQLSVSTASSYGYACYVIPDTDFVVSRNLQSATLSTTLTTANLCKGYGAPAVAKTGAAPLSPNGITAAGGGLPPSITLNVAWTGTGVSSALRAQQTFTCLDYTTDFSLTARAAAANATGSISMLTGSFTSPSAVVGSSDGTIDVSGIRSSSCPYSLG